MGLANWLTIVRILLIPVFVTLLVYNRVLLAFTTFVLAGLTDMLDGYIARTRGTKTRLGAFLDPLADKLLLTAAFVTLTYKFSRILPLYNGQHQLHRDRLSSARGRLQRPNMFQPRCDRRCDLLG